MYEVEQKLAILGIKVSIEIDNDDTSGSENLDTATKDSAATSTEANEASSGDLSNLSSLNLRTDVQGSDEEETGPCNCCCLSHHKLQSHVARPAVLKVDAAMPPPPAHIEGFDEVDDDVEPYLDVVTNQGSSYISNDPFLACMVALDTDFDL